MTSQFAFTALIPNLAGPDIVIIFLILGLMGIPVVGIILLIRFIVRRKTITPEHRLQQLNALLASRLITEAEYQDQRRRILMEI